MRFGLCIVHNLMKKRVQQYAVQIQGGFQHPRHVLKDFSRVLDTQNSKWDSTIGDGLRRSPIVRSVAVSIASCCFSALNAPVKLLSSVASPCCFVAASPRSLCSCTPRASNQKQKSVRPDSSFSSPKFNPETSPRKIRDASDLDTVVKVYCTHRAPDYSLPWEKQRQFTSTTGSAFMIGDEKLLTNAHCVEHDMEVKVRRRGDNRKYVAKVLVRSMECDLALLSVESEEFWKGAEPLRIGHLPNLQDSVIVAGYPPGGDTISVTKRVVSCIKVISYAHGSSDLLGVQINAAIKLGYSGGPVINDQKECIGVAFQAYGSEETNVIPTTVISHFLADYERNGKCTGFPWLGVLAQKLGNPALRECLKVSSKKGVLVRRVEPTSDAHNVLKEGDVIVSIDDLHVDCKGTVPFRSGDRIAFRYLISQKFAGDVAELGIIRAGEHKKVQVVVRPRVHLVPYHIDGQPSYIIVAGFVFTPLSGPLIEKENVSLKLLTKARYSMARFRGEQIVILSQVLEDELNIGYEDMKNQQVLKFNRIPIRNIHHLAHLIDMCKDKYLVFEFEDNYVAVLEREASNSASLCILKDYGIPSERSVDLFEPYVDPVDDTQTLDQAFGDSPVSNLEIGFDGLVWI